MQLSCLTFRLMGIQPDIRVSAFQSEIAEAIHQLIQFLADAEDLALIDAIEAQHPLGVVDFAYPYTLDVGRQHHRH